MFSRWSKRKSLSRSSALRSRPNQFNQCKSIDKNLFFAQTDSFIAKYLYMMESSDIMQNDKPLSTGNVPQISTLHIEYLVQKLESLCFNSDSNALTNISSISVRDIYSELTRLVPAKLKQLMMTEKKTYTTVEYIAVSYFVIKLIESDMEYIKIKDRWILVEQFFKYVPRYAAPMCDKVEVVNILIGYMHTMQEDSENDDYNFEELPSRSRSMSGGGMGNIKKWAVIILILCLFSVFTPMILGISIYGQRIPSLSNRNSHFDSVRDTQDNLRLMGIDTEFEFTQHSKYNIENYPIAIETSDKYIVGKLEFGLLKTNLSYSELREKLLTMRPPASAKHFDQLLATTVWPEIHPDNINYLQKQKELMTDQNRDEYKSDREYLEALESNEHVSEEQKVLLKYYLLSLNDNTTRHKQDITRDNTFNELIARSSKARSLCADPKHFNRGLINCLDALRNAHQTNVYSFNERMAIEYRQSTMLPTSVISPNTRYLAKRKYGELAPSGIPLEFQEEYVLVHYTSLDYVLKIISQVEGAEKLTSNWYRRTHNVDFKSYFTELDVHAKNKMSFKHKSIKRCSSQGVGIYFGYFRRDAIQEFFNYAMRRDYVELDAVPLVFDWKLLDDYDEWTYWGSDACGKIYDNYMDFKESSGTKYNTLMLADQAYVGVGQVRHYIDKDDYTARFSIHHRGEFVLRTDSYIDIYKYLDKSFYKNLLDVYQKIIFDRNLRFNI
jgi:hypothetical protein